MPRPRKCRRVCRLPATIEFGPVGQEAEGQPVLLTIDEFEALRLIDKLGLSQEECSAYMQVARTTVQAIYSSARKKLAEALVDGRRLRIEGGDYRLCEGGEGFCGCGRCHRLDISPEKGSEKEENSMKIAIPLDENKQDVCIVLARAPYFLFSQDGQESIVDNPAAQAQSGAGLQVAQFLVDNEADVLITVRCGENAAEVFQAAGMKIYKSLGSSAREDLEALAQNRLQPLTHFHGGFHGGQQ